MCKSEMEFQNKNNTIVWHVSVTQNGELIIKTTSVIFLQFEVVMVAIMN